MLAVKDLMWLIFGGSREAVYGFTNEVYKAHGNKTSETIIAELTEILDAINAKNSSSSPQS